MNPAETKHTVLDPTLYKAAMRGKSDVLKRHSADQLKVQLTRGNNTVLHIAAHFGQTKCVIEILQKCGRSLLCSVNIKGETSLHISAREGHTDIVQALIDYGKTLGIDLESGIGATMEMLRMRNGDGETALYEAVRNNHLDVVKILTKEDPEFIHPLSGPNGRTALHVAIMCGARSECIETLLHWNESLIKEGDAHGWRPLHYGAWSSRSSVIDQLLCQDKSVAYLAAEKDGNKTALHIAASRGNLQTMKRLLSHCPDCWEMLNSKGQNILHIAVEREKKQIIKFILKNPMCSSLINQKDLDGNTPIHLHAAKPSNRHYAPLLNRIVYEGKYFTYPFIVFPGDKDSTSKLLNRIVYKGKVNRFFSRLGRAGAENNLVVATLTATVSFAASFTVPGGYDGNDGPNQGMAVLKRLNAFKAFVLADAVALIFSVAAVWIHIFACFSENEEDRFIRYGYALMFILIAMAVMVMAFFSGIYVVWPNSSDFAIYVVALCSFYCVFALFCGILAPMIRKWLSFRLRTL